MNNAGIELPRKHALAFAFVRHDEIKREMLDEEFRVLLHRLAVKRVQDGVAGAVGGGAGALDLSLAVILGHAAKGALIDFAFFGA